MKNKEKEKVIARFRIFRDRIDYRKIEKDV